ncbi:coagulation factor XIII A chain-like [Entelurus aequoreus]|uniref:coagulation factor XIII A chain-like n=1 Tax=Entelurus aequoreus TaxID=161455 RepID=UPI002B1E7649|nr:coagulation factor XIII A chain-like [Entelurus aequoreus]
MANNHLGRYPTKPPTTNLMLVEEEFPEFEPFEFYDHHDDAVPGPRFSGHLGEPLSVVEIDMCKQKNKPLHRTQFYDIKNLVIRRGEEFYIRVTFNRPLTDRDRFMLEFLIGSHPSPIKGTQVVVRFNSRRQGRWPGHIVENNGTSVLFGIITAPNAIVGRYRMYARIVTKRGMERSKRDIDTDFYVLFNAWCKDDAVYYPDEDGRQEYVLNEYGIIYQGSKDSMIARKWIYGQFDRGILDACIYLLDACRMPITNRGDAIKLVRKGSAVVNSQDDDGVLVGNWSDNFSGGTAPTLWTGSVKILLQYANTGVSVSYAQCWVYAGVFNTFLRTLGIPARVITNFSSAHDNTGNLKIELVFKPDGSPDERNTDDSIWNYHCWNEVYMKRPDLGPGLGGWQVVDSTPQETSDGYYRCGPASVIAIKDGLVGFPFDGPFIYAEVNSDVIFLERDRYGNMNQIGVDTTLVGQGLFTKHILSDTAKDITYEYKYPEGSHKDTVSLAKAESHGLERDQPTDKPKISVSLVIEQTTLGDDVNVVVEFKNHGVASETIKANLSCAVVFYTGVQAKRFKNEEIIVVAEPHQTTRHVVTITAQEYMEHLGFQRFLSFMLNGHMESGSLSALKVIYLTAPALDLEVSGPLEIGEEMYAKVSFTNPFPFPLLDIYVALEGPRALPYRTRFYKVLEPQSSISWQVSFTPQMTGKRILVAVMYCSNLCEIWGSTDFQVSDKKPSVSDVPDL